MEVFRRALNPWGQEILVGLSWDLFWLAVAAGLLFMVVHALYVRRWGGEPAVEETGTGVAPDSVERHGLRARISHWLMAALVLALLITAFFPIIGIQFPWVTIHWIAGVGFTAYLVFHTVDAIQRGWATRMLWIGREDLEEARIEMARVRGQASENLPKQGKWGLANKLFHHGVVVAGLAAIVTGVLMTFRVDTPFWERNPYLFSDQLWGLIYVLHGVGSVGFVALTIVHVYFAARPDKWWITLSMIFGTISGEDYRRHHDPVRWPVGPTPSAGKQEPELALASRSNLQGEA